MEYRKAALFDLYDTLTYVDKHRYQAKLMTCASMCKVDPDEFARAWKSLVVQSNLGEYPATADRARDVMRIMGVPEDTSVAEAIADCEHEFLRSGIHLFDDVISTLNFLRRLGFKLGLVTNASPSVRIVIETHKLGEYMDCTAISSEIGHRKPDPMIYKTALKQLDVSAENSMFIGDGNDRELDGAHELGIKTVLVNRGLPKHVKMEDSSLSSIDFTIRSLGELIDLIKGSGEKNGEPLPSAT
ncbi:MAG TPA: HAD family hydrolase [Blastocatellia bacterium]|jgi:putative hydrolase of the HAD superfamily